MSRGFGVLGEQYVTERSNWRIAPQPQSGAHNLHVSPFCRGFLAIPVKRKIVKNIRNGEVILFAIALSIICYSYQNESQLIKPTYLNMFKKFYGDNW
jgi:hypothetical protein